VHHNNSFVASLQDSKRLPDIGANMSSRLEKGVQSRVQRLFKRKGAHYSAVPNEDAAAQRDSDRQILDADEPKDVNPQQPEPAGEPEPAAAEASTDTAEVPATATLLGASGVASDSQQARDAVMTPKKSSKSLLSCVHFSKKEKAEKLHNVKPSAADNKQSILKRLARSAKKSAPVTVVDRTPKPPKVCVLPFLPCCLWLLALQHLFTCACRDHHGINSFTPKLHCTRLCIFQHVFKKPAFDVFAVLAFERMLILPYACMMHALIVFLHCRSATCRNRRLRCMLLPGAPTPMSCWSSWQQELTWHAATR
jgi:hypothetical protein